MGRTANSADGRANRRVEACREIFHQVTSTLANLFPVARVQAAALADLFLQAISALGKEAEEIRALAARGPRPV